MIGINRSIKEKSPIATLSITNPTKTGMGSNLGLHSKWLVTSCLKHGTALDVYEEDISKYVGHLESKERLRIQPAQLFHFS